MPNQKRTKSANSKVRTGATFTEHKADKAPKPVKSSSSVSYSFTDKWRYRIHRYKPIMMIGIIGFVGGFLWLTGIRFLTIHPEEVHYHANFAVYINGEREEFKGPGYYEEIAACTSDYKNNVKGRTHMHDQVNTVIHVHDARVTYQDFFENISWIIGPDFIRTDTTLLANTDTAKVMYMLNGKSVSRVDNLVIGNEDRLLVSYGAPDTDINAQFKTVADTAAEVNSKQDPATCSGLNGPGTDGFTARLKRATFWE